LLQAMPQLHAGRFRQQWLLHLQLLLVLPPPPPAAALHPLPLQVPPLLLPGCQQQHRCWT
jgi:hypothetical protein